MKWKKWQRVATALSKLPPLAYPIPHSGEIVKLFVVRTDDSVSEEAIHAHCKRNLTNYKRPKMIEFRDELPKTNVGKILRRELR